MLWSIWSKKILILFHLQMKTKIAKMIPMIPIIFKNLMIQMMMWPLMEIIFLPIIWKYEISINIHIIILIVWFLKIIFIFRIVVAILVFICKRNIINNVLIICFKAFLANTNIARWYSTTKILMSPITIVFFFWRKIIKGIVCIMHTTWTCPPNS